jgi:hypothetical protein
VNTTLRATDARITVLAALAFLKDDDVVNATMAMSQYYEEWGKPDPMEAATALIGAALSIAKDLAADSDDFRMLTVGLVGSNG